MSGIGPAMETGLDAAGALSADEHTPATQAAVPAGPVASASNASATNAADTPASNTTATTVPPQAVTAATEAPATPQATVAGAPATTAAPASIAGRPNATSATTLKTPAHHPLGQPPSTAGSLGGTVFALFLVIGLILALGWLAKRMPGMARGGGTTGLRLVASLPVGARERIVVVDVGGTQLLLGVGAGGTRTLHTLEQPLPVDAGPATPQFAQLLAQHFGKKA